MSVVEFMNSIRAKVTHSAIAWIIVLASLIISGCETKRPDWTGILPEFPEASQNQPPTPISTALLERQVLEQVNQHRKRQKLPPFKAS